MSSKNCFDHRIARTVDVDGAGPQVSETTHFVYDGMHVWADFNESGEVLARYLYSEIVDDILARYRASDGIAWYLTDHLGTVRDIINNAGELLTTIHYNSFGQILEITDPAFVDRYLYTGREFDPLVNLYYYRARWYDPSLGRFLSQDPIGFRGGDANLYRYTFNGPTNATDPTGLLAITERAQKEKKNSEVAIVIRKVQQEFFKCMVDQILKGVPMNKAIQGCGIRAAIAGVKALFWIAAQKLLDIINPPPIPAPNPGGGNPPAGGGPPPPGAAGGPGGPAGPGGPNPGPNPNAPMQMAGGNAGKRGGVGGGFRDGDFGDFDPDDEFPDFDPDDVIEELLELEDEDELLDDAGPDAREMLRELLESNREAERALEEARRNRPDLTEEELQDILDDYWPEDGPDDIPGFISDETESRMEEALQRQHLSNITNQRRQVEDALRRLPDENEFGRRGLLARRQALMEEGLRTMDAIRQLQRQRGE